MKRITDLPKHIRLMMSKLIISRMLLHLFITYNAAAMAEEAPDSAVTDLQEVIIRQQGRNAIRRDRDGILTISTTNLSLMTRSMGEVDIINSLRYIAGVENGSDYGSGASIDGAEPSQTQYLIDGAPVMFPHRFGGIFSTFNTSHFYEARFSRISNAGYEPRLGGAIDLKSKSDYSKNGIGANINIGMLASSATVSETVAGKVYIAASGRVSYINQIYGGWLASSASAVNCSFHDLNFTAAFRLSLSDDVKISAFRSTDKVVYDDKHYDMSTMMNWSNTLVNAVWSHRGVLDIQTNAYYSEFCNKLQLDASQFQLQAPSKVHAIGIRCRLTPAINPGTMKWEAGGHVIYYMTTPLWANMQLSADSERGEARSSSKIPQHTGFGGVFGGISWAFSDKFILSGEADLGYMLSQKPLTKNYRHAIYTPKAQLQWLIPGGELTLGAAYRTQYMHTVGFSELGLASDFRIGASAEAPIEQATTFSMGCNRNLPFALRIETSVYYSLVKSQPEYEGLVMGVIDSDYDPFKQLIISDGYNIGGNVAIYKDFGPVTGCASYSYSTGKRHLKHDANRTWRARHSAGNVAKINFTWHEREHWELSASFRFASGRPYTPVKALYAISGNIALEYGERNSRRLPSYQRLDLGATYYFKTAGRAPMKHLINISLLNAYGHRNVEMQYFVLDSETGNYSLKRLYSLYRFLPSLSYSIEF